MAKETSFDLAKRILANDGSRVDGKELEKLLKKLGFEVAPKEGGPKYQQEHRANHENTVRFRYGTYSSVADIAINRRDINQGKVRQVRDTILAVLAIDPDALEKLKPRPDMDELWATGFESSSQGFAIE